MARLKRSPLAPSAFPVLPPVAGVRLAAGASGIRDAGRSDLLLVELSPGTQAAGVLTRSLTASAPVLWCRRALRGGRARGLVANSGNANAFTGKAGEETVREAVAAAARLVGCRPSEVFVASTGVIGVPLPADRIPRALPRLISALTAGAWEQAARAIMTTDTFPKGASRVALVDGVRVVINGIAKGSGMIAPDLATMLAFLFTDARLPASVLAPLLVAATRRSFNSITVDSDTSTSDTVLLFATGKGPRHVRVERPNDPRLRDFREKLEEVMVELAHLIVRDGEGASKFVTVTVTGAASERAARRIALAVADSPLVKTAIAGEDPNWGRIVMAVGKAGERVDPRRLAISIGGIPVAENGTVRPGYDEAPVAAYMKGKEIDISVAVGVGRGRATVWTCDLTHNYIRINADYRS